MIRRVLVPLDGSEYSKSALQYAEFMAAPHRANLTGLVVLDIPGIEKSVGPTPLGGVYWAEQLEKKKLEAAKARIETLLAAFRSFCDEKGLQCEEEQDQGSPSERIVEFSLYYDLVVVGQRTFFEFESERHEGKLVYKVMDHGITPFLAVPEKFFPVKRVLLAYDGSLAAARTLQRISHLAGNGDFEFTLLTSHDKKEAADFLLNRAEEYLRAYGCKVTMKQWTDKHIIDAVREDFWENTDLFAVGAHSRKNLKDFFVGSLTKFLIERGEKPVFVGL